MKKQIALTLAGVMAATTLFAVPAMADGVELNRTSRMQLQPGKRRRETQ